MSDDQGDKDDKIVLPAFVERLARSRVVQWVLPPALAFAAAGVHFSLNVPDKVIHSKRDQGSRGGAKGAAKPAPKPARMVHEDRTPEALDRLWAKYGATSFESEPVASAWARKFQAHLNKAVVVARAKAFEGAPESPQVVLTSAECRTIRCRFVLRGPFGHEVTMLAEEVKGLKLGAGPLWRDVQSATVAPPSEGAPKDHVYIQFTVAFSSDTVDSGEIVAGDEQD